MVQAPLPPSTATCSALVRLCFNDIRHITSNSPLPRSSPSWSIGDRPVTMPLPDERKASSAQSLIQRFESQIKDSAEAPLLPTSSFGSAGRPRSSQPFVSKGLGARSDDLRKSLDGRTPLVEMDRSKLDVGKAKETVTNSRPWLNTVKSADIPLSAPQDHLEAPSEEVLLSPIIVTAPAESDEMFAPEPTTAFTEEKSPSLHSRSNSDLGLPAKEGLSRPTSPVVDSGRLSAPLTRDDNSPPPPSSSNFESPPISPEPHITIPNSPSSSSIGSSRKGSVMEPTASVLAKAKPRISSSTSSVVSTPTVKASTAPVKSNRPLNSTSASPSTSRISSAPKLSTPVKSRVPATASNAGSSPSTSRILAPSPSPAASSSRMSPSLSRSSNFSAGSATEHSTRKAVGGAGGKKIPVPTTGTPRSRAAAAATAALLVNENSPTKSANSKAAVPPKKAPSTTTQAKVPVEAKSQMTQEVEITEKVKRTGPKGVGSGNGVLGYRSVGQKPIDSSSSGAATKPQEMVSGDDSEEFGESDQELGDFERAEEADIPEMDSE